MSAQKLDTSLVLPVSVVSRVDVGRLLRELQGLDGFLEQSALRTPGTPVKLPRTSKFMDDIIQSNHLNALVADDRKRMMNFLKSIYSQAPVMHMSFSADPSPVFVQKLTLWLRQHIHPLALLQVGLQPNMGAGCVVRTANKYFDFSLRHRFFERRDILVHRLVGYDK